MRIQISFELSSTGHLKMVLKQCMEYSFNMDLPAHFVQIDYLKYYTFIEFFLEFAVFCVRINISLADKSNSYNKWGGISY